MGKTLYRIRNWGEYYENNRSREIKNPRWCSIPNKQDGLGYRRMVRDECGEAAYGCFVATVLAASKHTRRDGWLTSDGTETGEPWDAEAISIKTGFQVQTVEIMLTYATSEGIGWIETAEGCGKGAVKVRQGCGAMTKEGKEGKEGKERVREDTRAPIEVIEAANKIGDLPSDKPTETKSKTEVFEELWAMYPERRGRQAAWYAFVRAMQEGVDPADIRKGIEAYIAYVTRRRKTDFPELKWLAGSKWFSEHRWEDEYQEPATADNKPTGPAKRDADICYSDYCRQAEHYIAGGDSGSLDGLFAKAKDNMRPNDYKEFCEIVRDMRSKAKGAK